MTDLENIRQEFTEDFHKKRYGQVPLEGQYFDVIDFITRDALAFYLEKGKDKDAIEQKLENICYIFDDLVNALKPVSLYDPNKKPDTTFWKHEQNPETRFNNNGNYTADIDGIAQTVEAYLSQEWRCSDFEWLLVDILVGSELHYYYQQMFQPIGVYRDSFYSLGNQKSPLFEPDAIKIYSRDFIYTALIVSGLYTGAWLLEKFIPSVLPSRDFYKEDAFSTVIDFILNNFNWLIYLISGVVAIILIFLLVLETIKLPSYIKKQKQNKKLVLMTKEELSQIYGWVDRCDKIMASDLLNIMDQDCNKNVLWRDELKSLLKDMKYREKWDI